MRVLFVSSEAHPLIKTGGLADVVASLPTALHRLGTDVRLLLPAYRAVKDRLPALAPVAALRIDDPPARVALIATVLPGTDLPVYLVDAPEYFDRAGHPYIATDQRDWQDNHLRFGLFAKVATAVALNQAGLAFHPQIVHCHDWQTGLVPALLHGLTKRPKTVFTVHNLAYQGIFPPNAARALQLPEALMRHNALEFYGQLSFIKGGLVYADRLTTVSPTYAQEILTPELGCGLDGLLRERAETLTGILNGIDYRTWDPACDRHLPSRYSIDDLTGKAGNKLALQTRLGLEVDPEVPIIGHIGRMVEQKGIDLLLKAFPRLLRYRNLQLAILGSGEARFEQDVRRLVEAYPGKVGAHIGYDESLAHLLEAGADLFAMPSRFEPCGLNQLYSLRYGTPPIARRTGGLADTIVDASGLDLENGLANGFLFQMPATDALLEACHRALTLYTDRPRWQALMQQGMARDSSWEHSAQEYLALYCQQPCPELADTKEDPGSGLGRDASKGPPLAPANGTNREDPYAQ